MKIYKTRFLLFLLFTIAACTTHYSQKNTNSLYIYLDNAELQYETVAQKTIIKQALTDMIKLPVNDLQNKKYPDYSGKANQWPLPVLISKYFVPDNTLKRTGNDFYNEVKSKKVQRKLRLILAEI